MNLGKWLAVGRSFLSGRGEVCYRENKRYHLPKFNTDRNPFLVKPAGVAQQEMSAVVPPVEKVEKAVPASGAALRPSNVPGIGTSKTGVRVWAERLNPFRGPEPAPVQASRPVQEELSLQAVKVMQNDLLDADVEMVPVKSRSLMPMELPDLVSGRGRRMENVELEMLGDGRVEIV